MELHLYKLVSSSPINVLCQVWLKLHQWLWRRRWICEKFTNRRTDRRRTPGNLKSSDELKKTNKPKITRMVKNRFRAKVWQLIYILTWWNELFCIFRIISYLYEGMGMALDRGISLTSDNWSYNLSCTLSWESRIYMYISVCLLGLGKLLPLLMGRVDPAFKDIFVDASHQKWLKHCGFALGISIFIICTLRERE